MRVLGSAPDAQASMRAWRFEPLPEIRTVRLCCCSVIVHVCCNLGCFLKLGFDVGGVVVNPAMTELRHGLGDRRLRLMK